MEKLAKKNHISFSQAEEIAEAPFRFFLKISAEADRENLIFDSVRILKWGVFGVKKGRLEHFKKIMENDKKPS